MSMTLQTNDIFILFYLLELHRAIQDNGTIGVHTHTLAIERTFCRVQEWNESHFEANLRDAIEKITDEFFGEQAREKSTEAEPADMVTR